MDITRAIRAPLVELCRRWRLCIDEEACCAECARNWHVSGLRGRELWAWVMDNFFSRSDGATDIGLCLHFIPDSITRADGLQAFADDLFGTLFPTCIVETSRELSGGAGVREVQCWCTRQDRAGAVSTFHVELDTRRDAARIERGVIDRDIVRRP